MENSSSEADLLGLYGLRPEMAKALDTLYEKYVASLVVM